MRIARRFEPPSWIKFSSIGPVSRTSIRTVETHTRFCSQQEWMPGSSGSWKHSWVQAIYRQIRRSVQRVILLSRKTFQKSVNDLILNVGAIDKLTFKNWYLDAANQNVLDLQVIAEAMAGFDANSTDSLLNTK